ncbi:hypothetical protein F4859DRAFT_465968 [Xylaria cf. heliscus]|nr:hypothetical protein F4859DRAFT_465968 [Xylaria cf. heliscus]
MSRYEYRPSPRGRGQFTIYMNSPFHAGIAESINRHMIRWLDSLIDNRDKGIPNGHDTTEMRQLAESIDSLGATMIKLGGKHLRGDCSYMKGPATAESQPSLVVLVGWSQASRKLTARARELIHDSNGRIRTVVGLDFNPTWAIWETLRNQLDDPAACHRGPMNAFVFRAVFDHRSGRAVLDAKGQPQIRETWYDFCDGDGKANLEQRLRLKLEDFVPEEVLKANDIKRKVLHDVQLVLDASTLMRFISYG